LRVRALGIYRDGAGSSQVLEVTKAGSIDDFFTKLEAIEQVSEHDSQLLDEVRDLTERVEKKEKRLATAQAKQKKVVKRAASAQKKMAKVLADRQAALAAANADVRAMMYEQRAAAARADATAARGRAAAIGRGDAPSEGASDGGSAGSSSGGSSGGGDTSIPLPPASGVAARAASIAMGKIGAPYVYGASGPNTFDCSGLISWAFAQAGRGGLPHSTYALMGMGVSVPLSQAQVGDIVITDGGGHGGIYVGGGSIVHAPRSGRTVTVESLGYYSVVTVRRI
jgi:cell wall-associated NlpC family hydrolase